MAGTNFSGTSANFSSNLMTRQLALARVPCGASPTTSILSFLASSGATRNFVSTGPKSQPSPTDFTQFRTGRRAGSPPPSADQQHRDREQDEAEKLPCRSVHQGGSPQWLQRNRYHPHTRRS